MNYILSLIKRLWLKCYNMLNISIIPVKHVSRILMIRNEIQPHIPLVTTTKLLPSIFNVHL